MRTSARSSGSAPDEVRSRARSALREIGGADPDAQVGLSDYLLGQADPIGRADAVRHLQKRSRGERPRPAARPEPEAARAEGGAPRDPRAAWRPQGPGAPPPPAAPAAATSAPQAPARRPPRPEGPRVRLPRRRLLQRHRRLERQAPDAVPRRHRGRPALVVIVVVVVATSGGEQRRQQRLQGGRHHRRAAGRRSDDQARRHRRAADADCPPSGQITLGAHAAGRQQQEPDSRPSPCRRTRFTCRPPPNGERYLLWLYKSDTPVVAPRPGDGRLKRQPDGRRPPDRAAGAAAAGVRLDQDLEGVSSTEAQQIQQSLQQQGKKATGVDPVRRRSRCSRAASPSSDSTSCCSRPRAQAGREGGSQRRAPARRAEPPAPDNGAERGPARPAQAAARRGHLRAGRGGARDERRRGAEEGARRGQRARAPRTIRSSRRRPSGSGWRPRGRSAGAAAGGHLRRPRVRAIAGACGSGSSPAEPRAVLLVVLLVVGIGGGGGDESTPTRRSARGGGARQAQPGRRLAGERRPHDHPRRGPAGGGSRHSRPPADRQG